MEQKPPLDISNEFETMDNHDLRSFLRERLAADPSTEFSLTTRWVDVMHARRVRMLFDDRRLKVTAALIRATQDEHDIDHNVFETGVGWEKV